MRAYSPSFSRSLSATTALEPTATMRERRQPHDRTCVGSCAYLLHSACAWEQQPAHGAPSRSPVRPALCRAGCVAAGQPNPWPAAPVPPPLTVQRGPQACRVLLGTRLDGAKLSAQAVNLGLGRVQAPGREIGQCTALAPTSTLRPLAVSRAATYRCTPPVIALGAGAVRSSVSVASSGAS